MIRVMLIDDEEDALDLLSILLGQMGDVAVAGRYMNPIQALEELEATRDAPVDAVFLDIQMPGMKGMEAARRIRDMYPGMLIVFTTAYAEHAVEAFEIQSIDYLLKPFTLERLRISVDRVQQSRFVPAAQDRQSASSDPVVRSMGGFQIAMPGEANKSLIWKTRKEKELCAFLIHYEGEAVDTATIIEALWPGHDLSKAKTYLYTCLSYLRKSLAEHHIGIHIRKANQGFMAVLNERVVDAIALEQLLQDVFVEAEMDETAYDKIKRMYRGDYMEACDYGWAAERQLAIKASYARALRKWCDWFQGRNNLRLAMDSLQTLLSLVPESESDGRELIRLLLETGNRHEAHRVLQQLEQAVQIQLGAELEEETLRLIRHMQDMDERRVR
ncbi:response regulator [Paenibacillus sp. HB172176]|uniref:response regulator n=1 Tax=Paenibacillus sp. HB172176 TaxID=2493690 RepID=UPI00143A3D65|nr:response regulator [Paenibacillus sp. HB172176]